MCRPAPFRLKVNSTCFTIVVSLTLDVVFQYTPTTSLWRLALCLPLLIRYVDLHLQYRVSHECIFFLSVGNQEGDLTVKYQCVFGVPSSQSIVVHHTSQLVPAHPGSDSPPTYIPAAMPPFPACGCIRAVSEFTLAGDQVLAQLFSDMY